MSDMKVYATINYNGFHTTTNKVNEHDLYEFDPAHYDEFAKWARQSIVARYRLFGQNVSEQDRRTHDAWVDKHFEAFKEEETNRYKQDMLTPADRPADKRMHELFTRLEQDNTWTIVTKTDKHGVLCHPTRCKFIELYQNDELVGTVTQWLVNNYNFGTDGFRVRARKTHAMTHYDSTPDRRFKVLASAIKFIRANAVRTTSAEAQFKVAQATMAEMVDEISRLRRMRESVGSESLSTYTSEEELLEAFRRMTERRAELQTEIDKMIEKRRRFEDDVFTPAKAAVQN